jgi:hypothetical protein
LHDEAAETDGDQQEPFFEIGREFEADIGDYNEADCGDYRTPYCKVVD